MSRVYDALRLIDALAASVVPGAPPGVARPRTHDCASGGAPATLASARRLAHQPTREERLARLRLRLVPVGRALRRRRAWNFDPTYADVKHTNLYGCTPCPCCGSHCRSVFNNDLSRVKCDDCGYRERVRTKPVEATDGDESL